MFGSKCTSIRVRTNTNAQWLPLIGFGKFPSGTHQTKNQKSQRKKKFDSPRGQQNTHTLIITNQQKQRKSSPVKAHRSNRRRRGTLRRPLRRPPRNGRSFPPSESSQRSINLLRSIAFDYGRSMFYWFFVAPLKQTDRVTHIHLHTYTHKYTEKPQTYASLQFSFHFAISI